jgi:peptide/nickel transport system permease protein
MSAGTAAKLPVDDAAEVNPAWWRRMAPHRGLVIGLILLAIIVLVAIFAPLLTPYDPFVQHLAQRRIPPVWHAWFWDDPRASWAHPLGTDKVGRDYWARLIFGARISLLVGFGTAIISCAIGAAIGVAGGFWGGRVDLCTSFLIQARLAMPIVLVALAAVMTFGGSLGNMVVVLSLLLWDRAAIMTRSATQQLRNRDYVRAARALGASPLQVILGEILPALLDGLLVVLTIEMGNAVLLEASLSFLGLGIRPPAPSWGLMLADAKEDIFFSPWAITIPGAALFLLVLVSSLIGDGLQDLRAPDTRR